MTNIVYIAFLFCVTAATVRCQGVAEDNRTHVSAEKNVHSKPTTEGEAMRSPRKKQLMEKLKRAVESGKKDDAKGSSAVRFELDVGAAIEPREPFSEGDVAARSKKSSSYYPLPQQMSIQALPQQMSIQGLPQQMSIQALPQQMSIQGLPPQGASIEIRPQSCYPYSVVGQPLGQSATAAATLSLTNPTTRTAQGMIGNGQAGYDGNQRWVPVLLACQPSPTWTVAPQRNCVVQLLASERRGGFKKNAGDGTVPPSNATSVGDAADAAVRQLEEEAERELAGVVVDDQAQQAALRAEQQERLRQWLRLNQQLAEVHKVAVVEGNVRSAVPQQTIILAPSPAAPLQTPYTISSGTVFLSPVNVPVQSVPVSAPLQTRPVVVHQPASSAALQPFITISSG
ncbi:hypothetical protein PR048_017423 [Dryococelus australis]|uniref:Uncharacterized protein n=1 Tax=Dryococelus australis TaxID=614101 RepID=A0ABQ9H9H2_9NEOP|nr:hypothetical protein PR048_017423 [Dryococelus australis]